MSPRSIVLVATALTLSVQLGQSMAFAAPIVLYDESATGDLSNRSGAPNDSPGTPTQLGLLAPGSGGALQEYRVIGNTDAGAADFFTIDIGIGSELQAITFTDITYANPASNDNGMFLAVSSGATFANSRSEFNNPNFTGRFGPPVGANWLGGALIGRAVEGSDILPTILGNANFGAITLDAPLGPGQYTFVAQQTGDPNSYTFDFQVASVTAIPEPGSLAALAIGIASMACRRRRNAA
ncbi:MAG: PEP-CTERM sorting domain-containing protein [Planctomycetota bacterium]